MIQSGRSGGGWGGSGIVTSMPDALAGDTTTLALAEASDAFAIIGTQTALFAGETVDATAVLVKYTWGGDANLDGKIDIDDYGQIDFNVGSSGSVFGWHNGDFNYDGELDIDDYGIIDFNITAQGAPLSAGSTPVAAQSPLSPDAISNGSQRRLLRGGVAVGDQPSRRQAEIKNLRSRLGVR